MPHPVSPVLVPGAPKIFPGNLSGVTAPTAKGEADFAELLRGSQNINGVPGGITKTAANAEPKTAPDGETGTATGLPSSALVFVSDNENGEPGDGDALTEGEDGTLVPLAVLSGKSDDGAVPGAYAPSTADQLQQTAPRAKSDPAAVPGEAPAPQADTDKAATPSLPPLPTGPAAPEDATARAAGTGPDAAVPPETTAPQAALTPPAPGLVQAGSEPPAVAQMAAEAGSQPAPAPQVQPETVAAKPAAGATDPAAPKQTVTPRGETVSAFATVQSDAARAVLTGIPLAAMRAAQADKAPASSAAAISAAQQTTSPPGLQVAAEQLAATPAAARATTAIETAGQTADAQQPPAGLERIARQLSPDQPIAVAVNGGPAGKDASSPVTPAQIAAGETPENAGAGSGDDVSNPKSVGLNDGKPQVSNKPDAQPQQVTQQPEFKAEAAAAARSQADAQVTQQVKPETPATPVTSNPEPGAATQDAVRAQADMRGAQTIKPETQAAPAVNLGDPKAASGETANGIDPAEDGTDGENVGKPGTQSQISASTAAAAAPAAQPAVTPTATAAQQTEAAAVQQAETQATSGTSQPASVSVQSGEMRETVATANTLPGNAAFAASRGLQMVDPEWPGKLTSMVRAAQEMGQTEIEIALQPEKLGKMTIRLDMRDSNVAVNIVTESDAAARMLNDNQSRLAELMQKAGLDLTQHQASSGQNFQGQNGQNGQGGQMAQNSQRGTAQAQAQPEDDTAARSAQTGPDTGIDIIA